MYSFIFFKRLEVACNIPTIHSYRREERRFYFCLFLIYSDFWWSKKVSFFMNRKINYFFYIGLLGVIKKRKLQVKCHKVEFQIFSKKIWAWVWCRCFYLMWVSKSYGKDYVFFLRNVGEKVFEKSRVFWKYLRLKHRPLLYKKEHFLTLRISLNLLDESFSIYNDMIYPIQL